MIIFEYKVTFISPLNVEDDAEREISLREIEVDSESVRFLAVSLAVSTILLQLGCGDLVSFVVP